MIGVHRDLHVLTHSCPTRRSSDLEAEKAPEGPHGGRLLTDGPLGLEFTIFENGQEPQFRIYPYWEGEPLDPGKVNLQINLSRLGGEVDRFTFRPQEDYLAGQGVVEEPHSFDVEVVAPVEGKRSRWTYENHRSEEHTSELQSLMRISSAVFCLKTKRINTKTHTH